MVIFWTLLLVLFIIFVQYFIFNRYVLKNVNYSRKIKQKHVFEHERCHLEEKIENNKRLWIPWLYVESQINANLRFGEQDNLFVSTGTLYQNHASFFMLKGYKRVTRTHTLTPVKRGVYYLTSVTLTSGDVLGFAKKTVQHQLDDHRPLVVYPQPIVPVLHLHNRDYSLGDYIVKRFIMPDPFLKAGTREYVPGDTYKSINWQATARTQNLQIHTYEHTSNKRLMVLINCEDHEEMWKTVSNTEQVEACIRYTSGVTEQALSEGIDVGFATNMPTLNAPLKETILLPQNGQAYWYTILETLSQLKVERHIPFYELLEQFINYSSEPIHFIIFTSYWNDKFEASAQQLRFRQHQVEHINPANLSDTSKVKEEAV